MVDIQITKILKDDEKSIMQCATMLHTAFPKSWAFDEALDEVKSFFTKDRIILTVIDENKDVCGWIGGISMYDGNVWELHPLTVRKDCRRKGIGSALVKALESEVIKRGGLTVWLGRTMRMIKPLYPEWTFILMFLNILKI